MDSSKTVGQEVSLTPNVDWSEALAENDRWLRTVIFARVGEGEAVDEVFQEVSLAAVRQQSPLQGPQQGGSMALPNGRDSVAALPPEGRTTSQAE